MTNYFEHIGDFLEGRLSAKERRDFESELKANTELQQAVENHHIVEEALDVLFEDDIRNVLSSVTQASQAPKSSRPGIITFLIIAAIMIVLALVAYLLKESSPPKEEILYAQHYSEYRVSTRRGGATKPLEMTDCDKGHALLQQEDFVQARTVLETAASVENECTDKAQWYLSLIYLRSKEANLRDSILSIINSDPASPYHLNARELIDKLER